MGESKGQESGGSEAERSKEGLHLQNVEVKRVYRK